MTTATSQLAIDGGDPVRDLRTDPWPTWPIYDDLEEQALDLTAHRVLGVLLQMVRECGARRLVREVEDRSAQDLGGFVSEACRRPSGGAIRWCAR